MKKKYLIYLIVGMIVAILGSHYIAASPSLQTNLSKYEPYPASPGETVKVWILVQNQGSKDPTDVARNIEVELVPTYPFSIYNDQSVKTIPVIGVRDEYLIDFTIKVDPGAVQGNNELKVKVKDPSSGIVLEQSLNIFVQSRDATIAIDSVKVDPAQISPGSSGKVTISVKNLAPTTFTDLNMKLTLQTLVGTTIVDLPFAPASSVEKRIYKLEPGQSAEFTFELTAYPDAIARIYKVPFTLEYSDNLGNRKNKTDFIGLTVNSVPDISVLLDATTINKKQSTGDITLKIVNKGLSDIKFLNVILSDTDKFDIVSTSDTTYVGNLESDDYQSIEYKISVNGNDKITLPVTLQYMDSNNKYYEVTQNVSMNVAAASADSKGTSPFTIILVVLVLGVVGWVIYRRTRKK